MANKNIIEANSNYNSEGFYSSLNTTLGRIEVGQVVNGWESPTLVGDSPVKKITPTIINIASIKSQLSAISSVDRQKSQDAFQYITSGRTWSAQEYLNYDIEQKNEEFEKGIFWLTRGGSLMNGGMFFGMSGAGDLYLGSLYGKISTTTSHEDPNTGAITVITNFSYLGSSYTIHGNDYIYFTQDWYRDTEGDGSIVPPADSPSEALDAVVINSGDYPIDFVYNDIDSHEESATGQTVYEPSLTIHVVGGAMDASHFAERYLTEYTDYTGLYNRYFENTLVRAKQYRTSDYRFVLRNFFIRPQLSDNQRWESGDDVWNPNPDDPGDGSGAGGAPGSASGGGYNPDALDGEDVGVPTLPVTDVARAKLCNVYNITEENLGGLTNWLWSSNFFDTIIKNFSSPMENIVMLGLVPYNQFQSTSSSVVVGNVTSEISANKLSKTMYELDCGTIDVAMPYNSFGSFEPYSKYQLYLPYIGIVDLPSDDVAIRKINGKMTYGQVRVIYHFDVFSGSCLAYVRTHSNGKWKTSGEYAGNILTTLPISQTNFLQVYQTLISARASIAQAGLNTVASVLNPTASVGSLAGTAGGVASSMADTVNSLIGIRPTYGRTGAMSGCHGMLGTRKPYLIKSLARIFDSALQRDNKGYVSRLGVSVGGQKGYLKARMDANRIGYIDGATEGELAEIKALLTSGIYI